MPGGITLPPNISKNVDDFPAKTSFQVKMKGGRAYLNSC